MIKLAVAMLSAVLVTGTARAQDDPSLYKDFGQWAVYRYADYCRAIAKYETSTMTIAYDSRQDLAVIHVRSQTLAGFSDGQSYPFEMLLLQNGTVDESLGTVEFSAINKSDFVGAVGSLPASRLFPPLAQSSALALVHQGKKIEAFELGTIATVTQSLKQCDTRR
jgi:hypothetical protein